MPEARVTAADCAFGVAMPLSPEVFHAQLRDRERHELASFGAHLPYEEGWGVDAAEVREACEEAAGLGARVVTDLRLCDLEALLRDRPVVAVLAHHRSRPAALELAEGFVPDERLAAAVPADYQGVLDLGTCRAVDLGETVKRRAPGSRVVLADRPVAAVFVAWRFVTVLRSLSRGAEPYTDVITRLTVELLRDAAREQEEHEAAERASARARLSNPTILETMPR